MTTATTITVGELYAKAHQAGLDAAESMRPTPMVVTTEDQTKAWYVADGVCGFAWIDIHPARGAFVNYLKAIGVGDKKSFEPGYQIWISAYNQSMQLKEAYANAFANVLREYGIRAYAGSRLD